MPGLKYWNGDRRSRHFLPPQFFFFTFLAEYKNLSYFCFKLLLQLLVTAIVIFFTFLTELGDLKLFETMFFFWQINAGAEVTMAFFYFNIFYWPTKKRFCSNIFKSTEEALNLRYTFINGNFLKKFTKDKKVPPQG